MSNLYRRRRPESERLLENDADLTLARTGRGASPPVHLPAALSRQLQSCGALAQTGWRRFHLSPIRQAGKSLSGFAAARDLFMAKLTARTKIFYGIAAEIDFSGAFLCDFASVAYLIARIAVLLLVIAGMWIWHRLAIRPLYADAPELSVRISMTEVRTKKASYTSWTTISLMIARLGLVVCIGVVRPAPTVRYSCGLPCSSFSSVLRQ